MIFVTLGTQDKEFRRLLDAALKLKTDDKVIIQYGSTKPTEKDLKKLKNKPNFELHQYISSKDFKKYMKEADCIVTHAGAGTIISGLKLRKKMVVAARRKEYKEHVNDHQLQLLNTFYDAGYIMKLDNFDDLSKLIKKDFTPKEFNSNKTKFNEYLFNEIELLTSKNKSKKKN